VGRDVEGEGGGGVLAAADAECKEEDCLFVVGLCAGVGRGWERVV